MDEKTTAKTTEQNLLEEINQRLIEIEKKQKSERLRRYIRMGINLAILAVLIIFVIPGVRNISEQYRSIKQEYDQMQAVISSINVEEVNDTLEQINALDIDKVNTALDQVGQLDMEEINGIATTINDADLEGTMKQLKSDLEEIENVYNQLKTAVETVSSLGGIFG